MIKKILIILIVIIIIIFFSGFFLIDKIFVKSAISNFENDTNVNITIKEPHKLNFIPNLSLFLKFDLEKKNENLFIQEGNITILKYYNQQPTKFTFKSKNINIRKINIKNLTALGEIQKYNLKYFYDNKYSKNLISNLKVSPEGYVNYNLNNDEKNSLKFINLIINRLSVPKIYKKISDMTFSFLNEQSYFTSKVRIDNEIIILDAFHSQKKYFHINAQGKYNLLYKKLDLNILIKENEKELVKVKILGSIENPNITVLSSDKKINLNFFINDFNQLLESGFEDIIQNLISNE